MSIRPIFVSVEGADGSGKTTAIPVILKAFHDLGVSMIATREPGGSLAGEKIRDIMNSSECAITPPTRLLVMMASRLDHLEKKVIPNLKAGICVLTDRYSDSTAVFQGRLDGLHKEIDLIQSIGAYGVLRKHPDYTFFLDIDEKTHRERILQRGMDYMDKLWKDCTPHEAYKEHFKQQTALKKRNIIRVDANYSLQEVHEALRNSVSAIVQNERMQGFLGDAVLLP